MLIPAVSAASWGLAYGISDGVPHRGSGSMGAPKPCRDPTIGLHVGLPVGMFDQESRHQLTFLFVECSQRVDSKEPIIRFSRNNGHTTQPPCQRTPIVTLNL